MKQFVQKGRCFVKIYSHIPFDPNTLDLTPQKTPNFIALKKEEKSSLEEGQRQGRRQQQQLLRNYSTPSKKSTPTRTLSEFTLGNKFIFKISLFRANKVTTSW
jgi:hypothetical protein